MPKWLQILAQVGPYVLALTPAAPLTPFVIAGIQAAEHLPGATGDQKKVIAQQIASIGAQGLNTVKGTQVIDPALVADMTKDAIDAVVQVTNAAHAAATSPAPMQAAPVA